MINKITLWKEEAFRGFEVTTNKNREKKFGWCGTGTKVDLDEFDNGNNCLVGFYLGYNKKESIINSMGFYYINKKTFYLLLNLGIFADKRPSIQIVVDGEIIVKCPSCPLKIKIIFDKEYLLKFKK